MTLTLTPFPWTDAKAIAKWTTDTNRAIAQYVVETIESFHPGFDYQIADILGALNALQDDHSTTPPQELAALAEKLTPGGAHDDALLIEIVRRVLPFRSPELTVATMYQAWKGGKVGFQFLPDPASTSSDGYEIEVEDLLSELEEVHPHQILIDHRHDGSELEPDLDRSFYDSLPDTFTVYRGCSGVTPEQCGAGVCWTTKREIAEWFAQRSTRPPVVVTARARKEAVRLAFASEHEVVMRAWRGSRPLKVRPVKGRPPMTWLPAQAVAA